MQKIYALLAIEGWYDKDGNQFTKERMKEITDREDMTHIEDNKVLRLLYHKDYNGNVIYDVKAPHIQYGVLLRKNLTDKGTELFRRTASGSDVKIIR